MKLTRGAFVLLALTALGADDALGEDLLPTQPVAAENTQAETPKPVDRAAAASTTSWATRTA